MGILTGIWLTLAGCGAPKAQVIMEAETAAADRTETQAGQELLGDPKERAEETVSGGFQSKPRNHFSLPCFRFSYSFYWIQTPSAPTWYPSGVVLFL